MSKCIFCSIANGETPSFVLFSDGDVVAILDIYPATPGHIIIFPRQHYERFEEIPDNILGKIIVLSKYLSNILSESLGAKGFNIFLASGELAGQRSPHIIFHLIPRYENDGLSFEWERKQVDPNILNGIYSKLINKLGNVQPTHHISINQPSNTNIVQTQNLNKNTNTNGESSKSNKTKERDENSLKEFMKNIKRWFMYIYES